MYKFIVTILFLSLNSLLISGQDDPPAPLIYKAPQSSELIEFTPSDESFKVKFAGKPNIAEQELPNKALVKVYNTYKHGSTSSITTIDFPFVIDKEDIYKRIKEDIVKLPKTEIKNEKSFTQGGIEGNELDVLQGFQYLKIKMILVENRFYEIKNTVTNWHILSDAKKKEFFDETSRFFDSFNFIVPQNENVKDSSELLGKVEGNTYNNKFFGVSLQFPKDWGYKSDEEIKKSIEKGLELYKSDNEKNNKELVDSINQEVLVFSTNAKDKSFGIGVLKQPNRYILSKTVAQKTKEMFLVNENVKLVEDIKEVNVNGTSYSTFSLNSFNRVNSKVYLTMKKGYSISFVLTSASLEGENELDKIMQSVNFDKK